MATDDRYAAALVFAYRDNFDTRDAPTVDGVQDLDATARRTAWAYTRDWYDALGWPMVVDYGDRGRPAAINAAVRQAAAGGARVIVQADPDSLVPLHRLRYAVQDAAQRDGLVVPHTQFCYLTLEATQQVYRDRRDPFAFGPADFEQHGTNGVGNVVVFSVSTWERAHGFDERFTAWGADDAAFAIAADAYCGPVRRLPGDVVHLWHPRRAGSHPEDPSYVDMMALMGEYRDAAAVGPHKVRELVENR